VFNVNRNSDGVWLNGNNGKPDNHWNGNNRCAFLATLFISLLISWGSFVLFINKFNLTLMVKLKNGPEKTKNKYLYRWNLFIGLIPSNIKYYEHLQECGFILIFKQTITTGETVKGNCDAELVLKTVSDFYTKVFDSCILITGDGDFGCLVEFLKENNVINRVLSPDKKKCSILIRNKNVEITFLNDLYHKFSSRLLKEKALDVDVST
jgi:hypothetical protein